MIIEASNQIGNRYYANIQYPEVLDKAQLTHLINSKVFQYGIYDTPQLRARCRHFGIVLRFENVIRKPRKSLIQKALEGDLK